MTRNAVIANATTGELAMVVRRFYDPGTRRAPGCSRGHVWVSLLTMTADGSPRERSATIRDLTADGWHRVST